MSDKPKFDPSKPYEVGGKPRFDPGKSFEVVNPPAKEEGVASQAGAAMRGGAQGITFGYADEATAGVGGLIDWAQGKLGMRGDISLSDAYHTRRDAIRMADAKAEDEFPKTFVGGQVGGGLLTAFVPGLGAMNAVKGAGVAQTAIKGAAAGALAGTGSAREITDIPDEGVKGALLGGAIGGGAKIAGKMAGAIADKLKPAKVGSVLLNAPEQAIERYIKNPEAVKAARPRAEIVEKDFLPRVEKLGEEATLGSQTSREILKAEGAMIPTDRLAEVYDTKAQEILKRSEGIIDDPQVAAALRYLESTRDMLRNAEVKEVSTNRVKDMLQSLDKRIEFETAPGQKAQIDDVIRGDVRKNLDKLLKGDSPAYAQQMETVARDTRTLKGVSDLARTPQGFDALLKRTQRGTAPHQMEALKAFDARTGGGLIQELENSATKDALAKGATNGSRNVNLFGAAGDAIGEAAGGIAGKYVGRVVGLLQGATIDKYGPAMAKNIVDGAVKLERLLESSQGIKELGKYAGPLLTAAREGNQSLATTHAFLTATDPTYRQIMAERENAMQRRIQRTGE